MELKIIARMRSLFPDKYGIPRQSGLVEGLHSTIVFEPEYRNPDALRGIEDYSHLWLIWGFSETGRDSWSPTVRPPRLGGNTRMGVFATRSTFRPNALALSCVQFESLEATSVGTVIHVSGADLMDGSPIYDIKPYLSFTDAHPEAKNGFADGVRDHALNVAIPEDLLQIVPEHLWSALKGVLAQDPRPAYHDDPDRIYGFLFGGFNVRFWVRGNDLKVIEIENAEGKVGCDDVCV